MKTDTISLLDTRFTFLRFSFSLVQAIVASILLIGLLLRIAFAILPQSMHFMLLEDDAWMVTNIARHWALGHGITADGVHPTNGFHPLYPLTLGAIPYLINPTGLDAGFQANMLICALLNTLALLPLYGIVRRVARQEIALAGLALIAINPFFIRVSVNAMETSLALLLLLGLWYYALRTTSPNGSGTIGQGIIIGLLAALAILARLDNMIAAGLLGLVILWRDIRRSRTDETLHATSLQEDAMHRSRTDETLHATSLQEDAMHRNRTGETLQATSLQDNKKDQKRLRQKGLRLPTYSVAYAITTGLLLLPYFARNVIVFGHLTPSSGRALSYMHSFKESFAFSSGLQLIAYQPAIDMTWAPPWVLIIGGALFVGMILLLSQERRRTLFPMILYAFVLTFYYAYLQQQGHPRYYVAVGIVVVLICCAWLDTMWQAYEQRHPNRIKLSNMLSKIVGAITFCLILLNTMLFASYLSTLRQAPYLAQPSMYQAARWIAQYLPPDARLAAQNSGVFQYYSERVVLNIDGKLNHEIIPVLERRDLDSYLVSKQVQYLVDLPGVADYITFYSSNLSDAPAHYEVSPMQKLRIYANLVAAKVGIGSPVHLDERVPTRIIQPFDDVVEVVATFPLPNNPSEAVTIYRFTEAFGKAP